MVHANAVGIEEMRGKLLTLDDVQERLAAFDPAGELTFEPPAAQVRIGEHWGEVPAETDLTDAWLRIGGQEEHRLTKKAMLEIGARCRIPRKLQADWPVDLLQTVVNRAMTERITNAREFKLLTGPESTGLALTSGTISPFPNTQLLGTLLDGIEGKYGQGEVLADYKFHHDFERTDLRLIVPGQHRVITGTRVADDTWSAGLHFQNSLTGTEPTAIDGYLFRWWCTNGCTDTLAHVQALNRRQVSSTEEAMEWARATVDEVLGGLETSFDAVQALTGVPIAGDVGTILRGLFNEYSVPARERQRIIAEMAETDGDLTMYDLQAAATVAANADGLSPDTVASLLSLGGQIAHVQRCDETHPCRRPLPSGWAN